MSRRTIVGLGILGMFFVGWKMSHPLPDLPPPTREEMAQATLAVQFPGVCGGAAEVIERSNGAFIGRCGSALFLVGTLPNGNWVAMRQ